METYQIIGLCAISFIAGCYCAILATIYAKGN